MLTNWSNISEMWGEIAATPCFLVFQRTLSKTYTQVSNAILHEIGDSTAVFPPKLMGEEGGKARENLMHSSDHT